MSKTTEETSIKTFFISRYMEKALINERISKIKAYTGNEMVISFRELSEYICTSLKENIKQTKVTHLKIMGTIIDCGKDLMEIITAMPELEKLTISNVRASLPMDCLLESPKLKEIEIICSSDNLPKEDLDRLIKSGRFKISYEKEILSVAEMEKKESKSDESITDIDSSKGGADLPEDFWTKYICGEIELPDCE